MSAKKRTRRSKKQPRRRKEGANFREIQKKETVSSGNVEERVPKASRLKTNLSSITDREKKETDALAGGKMVRGGVSSEDGTLSVKRVSACE